MFRPGRTPRPARPPSCQGPGRAGDAGAGSRAVGQGRTYARPRPGRRTLRSGILGCVQAEVVGYLGWCDAARLAD